MFKKYLYLLLLGAVILMTACTQQDALLYSYMEEPKFTKSQTSGFVYQNNFYYIKNGIIFYCSLQDLKDIDNCSQCLCFDPLCEHKGSRCSACTGAGDVELCIRSINGSTMIYTKYKNLLTDPETYEIAQFDINNSGKEILVDGIVNPIEQFIVSDSAIIFEENLGDHISLQTYSFTDNECYKQINNDLKYYKIIGCTDDTVIYNDEGCNVYSSSYQFEQEKKLLTGILPYGYDVCGEILYFPNNPKSLEMNGMSYNSVDICKTSLSDPSTKKYDIVAFNVCCYGKVSAYIFGDKLYYLPCEPSYVGEIKRSYDDMPEMTYTIINEHNGILYEVDTATNDEDTVVEDLGYNIYDLLYASQEYVIFISNASGYEYETGDEYNEYNAVFVYERDTDDLYQILYYGI